MLKSDGHLACDDSAGYEIHVGRVVDAAGWNIARVFSDPIYRHIRQSFLDARAPRPGTCENCDLFCPGDEARDTLLSSVSLQVEPTRAVMSELRPPS
jgi:hypothetical protein